MNKKIIFSFLLVVFWMGFIFYMSSMNNEISNGNSLKLAVDIVDKVDKITNASNDKVIEHKTKEFQEEANHILRKTAHGMSYLILSLLTLNFLMQIKKFKYITKNIINIIFCFLYACTDEYHQTFVNGRSGQFYDILIDTIGVLVGCIVFFLLYKIIMKRRKRSNQVSKNDRECRIA